MTRAGVRPAVAADAERVAAIWEEGWREVHPGEVPDALLAVRTSASFRERATERLADTLVAQADGEAEGEVVGFVMTDHDEVDQLYIAPTSRGTGAATALLVEAEQRIRDAGHVTAWLAVVGGNARARAFYARQGWVDDGEFTHHAPGPDGPILLVAHRYVKRVAD